MVVSDELEYAALRENGRLIVEGAVFESEDRPRGDLVSMDDLSTVSRGKRVAICVAQFEITVDGSLDVADRCGFSRGIGTAGTDQQGDQGAVSKSGSNEVFHVVASGLLDAMRRNEVWAM